MALLTDLNRFAAWREAQGPTGIGDPGITKTDLRLAVDAIDNWVDANSAAFNLAIPQPARNSLTAKQKAALLMLVVQKRWGEL